MGKSNSTFLIIAVIALLVVTGTAFAILHFMPSSHPEDEEKLRASETTAAEKPAEGTSADQTGTSALAAPEDSGFTVYIETGHGIEDNGNWDPGCSWSDGTNSYEEATLMIPIARAMADYLQQSGVEVYTDADDDNDRNLAYTLDFLDEHPEVDAFVNIHCDWEDAASGAMPLYRTDEQRALAEALSEGVHEYVDIPDRGITYREDLDTLTSEKVHCPAVLFETGGIRADNETLTTKYDDYGKGLAAGMCRYLGVRPGF